MSNNKITLAPTQWGRGLGEGVFGVKRRASHSSAGAPPHPDPLPLKGEREDF